LVARYRSSAAVVHPEDSTIEMVVNGRVWMARMCELLGSVRSGDALYTWACSSTRSWIWPCGQHSSRGMSRSVSCWLGPPRQGDVQVVLAGAVANSLVRPLAGPLHGTAQTMRKASPSGGLPTLSNDCVSFAIITDADRAMCAGVNQSMNAIRAWSWLLFYDD
jgi:hypothetical protein